MFLTNSTVPYTIDQQMSSVHGYSQNTPAYSVKALIHNSAPLIAQGTVLAYVPIDGPTCAVIRVSTTLLTQSSQLSLIYLIFLAILCHNL